MVLFEGLYFLEEYVRVSVDSEVLRTLKLRGTRKPPDGTAVDPPFSHDESSIFLSHCHKKPM